MINTRGYLLLLGGPNKGTLRTTEDLFLKRINELSKQSGEVFIQAITQSMPIAHYELLKISHCTM